jgi:glycosyltransferase involved in cell wall biosynthesis
MPQTHLQNDLHPLSVAPGRSDRFIYIACPWTPVGGGMFKVADYLIQSQAQQPNGQGARLEPLDTRGARSAVFSLWVLFTAMVKIVRGRLDGRLAGVHVNTAEKMSLFRKGTVILTCRAMGIPVVLHLHAPMHEFYRALPRPLQALTRWVFQLASSVLVIGPAAWRFVTEEMGVPARRVETIINGVPERRQPPDDEVHSDGKQHVLFLGNLSERKGVTDLLRAVALPGFDRSRVQVTIAGGGNVAAYRARAREFGVDGFVQFPGWCDQDQAAELLARADVLVLPSFGEVLPLVILEALAYGVPVVTTAVGEIPSLLTDGITVRYVEPGDSLSIAQGLQDVLDHPDLREALARNGRALYEQQFSLPRFFANIARVHRRHFGVAGQPRETAAPEQEAVY